jgi:hypothetical protein
MCLYIGFWSGVLLDKGELRNKSLGLKNLKKGFKTGKIL